MQLGQCGACATRGTGEHSVDSIDHRLQLGRGVDGCGTQNGYGFVDSRQVAGADLADARVGVVCRGGGWAACGVVGKSGQRGLCSHCCGGPRCGQTLQLRQCVHAAAVVSRGCNGVLHGGQVVAGDARDGQCLQLGQARGRATRCGTQHRVNGIDHGLKFGRGVGGCRCQREHGIVDGGHVASGDSADTRVVVIAGGGGATASAASKSGQRSLRCRSSVGGCSRNALQVSQIAHAAAVVRGSSNGVLYGGQVVAGEACDVQCLQLGQAGGRAASCCIQHGVDRVHHGLKFGRGVGGCRCQCEHGIVDGGHVASADRADTRVGVIAGGGGAAASAASKGGQRSLRCRSSVGGCVNHDL